VDEATLRTLFEAARWAPSCYNEQPWTFLYADREPDLARFKSILVEANQVWNEPVPVVSFLVTRLHFARNGKPNPWAELDAGSAWVSLALQAKEIGLAAHAMAGFDQDAAYRELGVPRETHKVCCAIAVGHPGDPESLPEKYREKEAPSPRKPLTEVARRGPFEA
jgi:nitroreductase